MKKAVLQVEAKLHGNGYERKDWHLVDLENFTAGYCQKILHGFFTFYQVKSFFIHHAMIFRFLIASQCKRNIFCSPRFVFESHRFNFITSMQGAITCFVSWGITTMEKKRRTFHLYYNLCKLEQQHNRMLILFTSWDKWFGPVTFSVNWCYDIVQCVKSEADGPFDYLSAWSRKGPIMDREFSVAQWWLHLQL